jgi:tetratricopeptide (TPR) repeat protein/trans-aconitate methyltransferase
MNPDLCRAINHREFSDALTGGKWLWAKIAARACEARPLDRTAHDRTTMALDSEAVSTKKDIHALLTAAERAQQSGELGQAEALCRKVIGQDPESVAAHVLLGSLLHADGQMKAALAAFQVAIEQHPGCAEAYTKLGALCLELGRAEEAALLHAKAVSLQAGAAHVYVDLGQALRALGRFDAALEAHEAALTIDHTRPFAVRGVVQLLARHALPPDKPLPARHENTLLAAFHAGGTDAGELAGAAANLLKQKHAPHYKSGTWDRTAMAQPLATDELFLRLLQETINIDTSIEALCVGLRRNLLTAHRDADELPTPVARLAAALSLQGFHNEYVFPMEQQETEFVATLEQAVIRMLEGKHHRGVAIRAKVLQLAMYRPLLALPNGQILLDWAMAGEAARIVTLTIRDVLEVRAAEDAVPAIAGSTSDTPAPERPGSAPHPWWAHFEKPRRIGMGAFLARCFPDFRPPEFFAETVDLLVAGCGSGLRPIRTALRHPNSKVLAIDGDRANLAYATRMAQKLGVTNIEFAEADIMALGNLPRRFHLIECTAALNHMKDPEAGWQVLSGLLVPQGLFRVVVNSELGRGDVLAARAIIARDGLNGDRDGIRAFRRRVIESDDQALRPLLKRPEFYSMTGCRDLAFQANDHCCTPHQLEALIETHGLRLIGMFMDDETRVAFREVRPDDASLNNFSALEDFERHKPDAFAGGYHLMSQKTS